jgi:CRP-like cAMP-binding protein
VQPADYFKQLPLFSDLGPSEIIDVLRIARVVQFAPGETLCTRGEQADCAYLIEEGTASVRIAEGKGAAIEVARVGRGEVLGELALVDGHPRSADVVALTVVRGYRIDRSEFDLMRRAMHPAAFKMLRRIAITVSDRLRDINDAIASELATPAPRGAASADAAEAGAAAARATAGKPQRKPVAGPANEPSASRAANRASREIGRATQELGRFTEPGPAPRARTSVPHAGARRSTVPSAAATPRSSRVASAAPAPDLNAASTAAEDNSGSGSFWRSVLGRVRGVAWK